MLGKAGDYVSACHSECPHNAKALLKEQETQHIERNGVQRSVVEVRGLPRISSLVQ